VATYIYDIEVQTLTGDRHPLRTYEGSALLVVNTASQCGFTPQYADLQSLWEEFQGDGLVVLGFPCNQFGRQEPGTHEEIGAFCERNYGVTFPMYAKIDVNGANAHPLYDHLKAAAPGAFGTRAVKWNFTKFLVDRRGAVRDRFAPMTKPDELRVDIQGVLGDR